MRAAAPPLEPTAASIRAVAFTLIRGGAHTADYESYEERCRCMRLWRLSGSRCGHCGVCSSRNCCWVPGEGLQGSTVGILHSVKSPLASLAASGKSYA